MTAKNMTWAKFQTYTFQVQSLETNSPTHLDKPIVVPQQHLEAACPTEGPLLPNSRDLTWEAHTYLEVDLVAALASPSLRSLSLTFFEETNGEVARRSMNRLVHWVLKMDKSHLWLSKPPSHLRPLLAIRELQWLEIVHSSTLDVRKNNVCRMAKAWPGIGTGLAMPWLRCLSLYFQNTKVPPFLPDLDISAGFKGPVELNIGFLCI